MMSFRFMFFNLTASSNKHSVKCHLSNTSAWYSIFYGYHKYYKINWNWVKASNAVELVQTHKYSIANWSISVFINVGGFWHQLHLCRMCANMNDNWWIRQTQFQVCVFLLVFELCDLNQGLWTLFSIQYIASIQNYQPKLVANWNFDQTIKRYNPIVFNDMFNLTANYTASGNKPTLSVGICLQPQIESEFAGLKFHRSVSGVVSLVWIRSHTYDAPNNTILASQTLISNSRIGNGI